MTILPQKITTSLTFGQIELEYLRQAQKITNFFILIIGTYMKSKIYEVILKIIWENVGLKKNLDKSPTKSDGRISFTFYIFKEIV